MEEEQKSYYDELHEKMANTNWESVKLPPSGSNGYVAAERIIVAVLCTIFLVLISCMRLSQGCNYLTRDRELTLENYKNYITLSVDSEMVANPDVYQIIVTAKKNVISAELSVEVHYIVAYGGISGNFSVKSATFSVNDLGKGDTYFYSLFFDTPVFCRTVQVKSISGRLP